MIEEFRLVGKKLFEEGLISSHSGNLSIKRDGKIFITRHGAMLSELNEEDIIEVPLQGAGPNDQKASKELVVHRAVYNKCKALALIHAHPPYAIALSVSEEKIHPQDAEGRFYMRSIPVVKTKNAFASEEAERQLPAIFNGGYHTCMLKGHGSFAEGESLLEAYKFTSVLSQSCHILSIIKTQSKPAPSSSGRKENTPPYRKRAAISEGIGIMGRRMSYRKR
ncbi:MAG: class II aldolase/adducin family protein [Candidatus Saganbacteria bacterium]|nr:class II aldolase/adducin family protein [Candidatus Saganbacteria bacterium]